MYVALQVDKEFAKNVFFNIFYVLNRYLDRKINSFEYVKDIIDELKEKSYGGR